MKTINKLINQSIKQTEQHKWHIGNYSAYLASESPAGMTVEIYYKARKIASWKWDALRDMSVLSVFKRRRLFAKASAKAEEIREAIEQAGFWSLHSSVSYY